MTINLPNLPKSWITSFFGLVMAVGTALHLQGIHIGHAGNGDYIDVAIIIATAGLGITAKAINVHSTTAEVQASTMKAAQEAVPTKPA